MNIFITGASSGIGNAIAHEYAKRYANTQSIIGLVARRSEHLQQLATNLQNQYNISCAIYPLDVRDATALEVAAQDFIARFGAPNIVIASAGVSRGTLTELKEDITAFQAIFDINVMGMMHTFQPFITAMKLSAAKGDTAQLVGVASVAGIRGIPGSGAYSASKAAVISYCESLRTEMQHFNIAVSTIAPGYIRTPMTELNQYKMPFLMDADVFAHKFANAVEAKVRFKIIPWQMGLIARLMRLIPPRLWDYLMKNAPHKKRIDWDWL
ncbi:MAG: SDR family oxidoreductase [Bdellovibrio sp.]|nr:SDR family oxidoreductase [Methylotenera sp.]